MSESITNHDKPAGHAVYGAPVTDTGYTVICPTCLKRSGGPVFGVREIKMEKCSHHWEVKVGKGTIKHPRPIF